MVGIVLTVPSTGIVNEVGIVNRVPTFGISTEAALKASVTFVEPGLIVPLSMPFIETEIGELLPRARGAVSVSVRVKLDPEGIEMLVLDFTPVRVKVPRDGLPFVVMSVSGCGV